MITEIIAVLVSLGLIGIAFYLFYKKYRKQEEKIMTNIPTDAETLKDAEMREHKTEEKLEGYELISKTGRLMRDITIEGNKKDLVLKAGMQVLSKEEIEQKRKEVQDDKAREEQRERGTDAGSSDDRETGIRDTSEPSNALVESGSDEQRGDIQTPAPSEIRKPERKRGRPKRFSGLALESEYRQEQDTHGE